MIKAAHEAFKKASELAEAGDLSAALKEYRQAVNLAPDDARHWIGLGVCLNELRHWTEAIKALRKGIELKPHYAEADARLFLAEALLADGQKSEAIKQWKIVEEMEPNYPSDDLPMEEARKNLAKHKK
jgi:Flp pilus assembly protein TadD